MWERVVDGGSAGRGDATGMCVSYYGESECGVVVCDIYFKGFVKGLFLGFVLLHDV